MRNGVIRGLLLKAPAGKAPAPEVTLNDPVS